MKKAALEGMVLVKNEGNLLPIQKGTKIALFGKGTVDYVKGGGGSGDVTVEYSHSLLDGMKDKVLLYEALNEFYKEKYDKIEWSIKNRGHEATIAKKRNIPLTQYTNTLNCSATTEYTGHHYIICKIHRNGRPIAEEYFGIYVNDR